MLPGHDLGDVAPLTFLGFVRSPAGNFEARLTDGRREQRVSLSMLRRMLPELADAPTLDAIDQVEARNPNAAKRVQETKKAASQAAQSAKDNALAQRQAEATQNRSFWSIFGEEAGLSGRKSNVKYGLAAAGLLALVVIGKRMMRSGVRA